MKAKTKVAALPAAMPDSAAKLAALAAQGDWIGLARELGMHELAYPQLRAFELLGLKETRGKELVQDGRLRTTRWGHRTVTVDAHEIAKCWWLQKQAKRKAS